MRIAAVIGKYRDSRGEWYVEANRRAAEECAVDLWRMGFSVFCPHLNSGGMDGAVPDAAFLAGGLEMIRRLDPATDIVVALKGWEESAGARDEFCMAADMGLHVEFWPANRMFLADLIERDRIREMLPPIRLIGTDARYSITDYY